MSASLRLHGGERAIVATMGAQTSGVAVAAARIGARTERQSVTR